MPAKSSLFPFGYWTWYRAACNAGWSRRDALVGAFRYPKHGWFPFPGSRRV